MRTITAAPGFRSSARRLKGNSSAGFCRLWLVALVTVAMLLPAFGIIEPRVSLWYALVPVPLVIMSGFRAESALFSYLNLFPLLVTLLIFIQK